MSNLINNILKLSELKLAHENCDKCIFKVVQLKDEPCRSCKYGKFAGIENNFVKEED
jgi:hypothetical protein